jgi:hypothetical protein
MQFVLNFWEDNDIREIQTMWDRNGGTNTEMFRGAINNGQSPYEAAKNTWTGKRLAQLGFSKVEVNTSDPIWIYAFFSKPE